LGSKSNTVKNWRRKSGGAPEVQKERKSGLSTSGQKRQKKDAQGTGVAGEGLKERVRKNSCDARERREKDGQVGTGLEKSTEVPKRKAERVYLVGGGADRLREVVKRGPKGSTTQRTGVHRGRKRSRGGESSTRKNQGGERGGGGNHVELGDTRVPQFVDRQY